MTAPYDRRSFLKHLARIGGAAAVARVIVACDDDAAHTATTATSDTSDASGDPRSSGQFFASRAWTSSSSSTARASGSSGRLPTSAGPMRWIACGTARTTCLDRARSTNPDAGSNRFSTGRLRERGTDGK